MKDWNETQESREAAKPQEGTDRALGEVGQSTMQGDWGGQLDKPQQDTPKDDERLVTTHAGRRPEHEPPVETEPRTIQLDPEDQSEDSEGTGTLEGKRGSLEAPDNYNPRGIER